MRWLRRRCACRYWRFSRNIDFPIRPAYARGQDARNYRGNIVTDASQNLDRVLVLEMVRVTEAAAVGAAKLIGRGDEKAADAAAVEAMRAALNALDMDGTVVIGEGERDEAPMLYIGEKVGSGSGPSIDIALDPLEGTTITAKAGPNALAVLAIAEKGGLLNAPDVYMDKIAVGPGYADGVIDLAKSATENVRAVAAAKGVQPGDIIVCVLDRPRHEGLIAELRALGCGIQLIPDGDVAGVIAVTNPDTGIDLYMGSGGAPEGVLAAAALRCVGGQFQGRLLFRNEDERARARKWGIENLDRIYALEELAKGDVIFAATGVTDGSLLDGVKRRRDGAITTESIVMRASSGTVRRVYSEHRG
ncbi:MAG: class II fructose-bisphosphatase [Sphingomonadaceae bacterium]|nr:class II fructose-bisphosphatase [Sphingomonadaceae bacterium]